MHPFFCRRKTSVLVILENILLTRLSVNKLKVFVLWYRQKYYQDKTLFRNLLMTFKL